MDWKLIEDKSWSSLERQFEWVREMNTVPQDTRYHAEGNVAITHPYGVRSIAAICCLSVSFCFGERNSMDSRIIA